MCVPPQPAGSRLFLTLAHALAICARIVTFGPCPNSRRLRPAITPAGGRNWWARLESTRMNTELTIPRNQFEEVRQLGAFMVRMAKVGKPYRLSRDCAAGRVDSLAL